MRQVGVSLCVHEIAVNPAQPAALLFRIVTEDVFLPPQYRLEHLWVARQVVVEGRPEQGVSHVLGSAQLRFWMPPAVFLVEIAVERSVLFLGVFKQVVHPGLRQR